MSSNIRVQRVCQHCGKEFTAKTTVTKYCSDRCSKAGYKEKQRTAKIEKSNKELTVQKAQPIEALKAKEFLNINEVGQLLGISRRTVYRMFDSGAMAYIKIGRRTLVKRETLDKFINNAERVNTPETPTPTEPTDFDISEGYTLKEIQEKYGISEKALYNMIEREQLPKKQAGRYTYVPKAMIDNLLK